MMKHFLNQYIKSALGEIFVDPEAHLETKDRSEDTQKQSVFQNLLSILSVQDELTFTSLSFKPDTLDILLHPVKLVSGSLGRLKLNGLMNAYAGGSLSVRADNLFLLFHVEGADSISDPEKAHIMKKLYLELQSKVLSDSIINSLVYKLFNIPYNGDAEAAKKERSVYLAGIKHILRTLQVVVKTIHIRLESDVTDSTRQKAICNAVGVSLPSLTIGNPKHVDAAVDQQSAGAAGAGQASAAAKQATGRGNSGKKPPRGSSAATDSAPVRQMRRPPAGNRFNLNVNCKSLQLYADYQVESYLIKGYSSEDIHHLFAAKWKSEVHTGVLLPFDVSMGIALELDEAKMLCVPSVDIDIPQFHMAFDPKQLEVMMSIIGTITRRVNQCRSHMHLTRSGVMVRGYQMPLLIERTSASKGRHVLPMLSLGGASSEGVESRVYPNDTLLSGVSRRLVDNRRSSFVQANPVEQSRGIVSYLKERVGPKKWVRVLWKYVTQLVIHDLRAVLPLGRWRNLVDLVWSRKEYAYMYSKLLKPSKAINSFQYMPSKSDNPYELIKIHQYEMVLPVNTILAFRAAAVAVAAAVHIQRTLFEVSNPYSVADPNGSLQNEVEPMHYPPTVPATVPSTSNITSNSSDSRKKSLLKSSFGSMTNAFDKMSQIGDSRDRPPSPEHVKTKPAAVRTGGEFEESIKFAKQVKRALNKVQWRDIICMLTQLEKLSEGSEQQNNEVKNDDDTVTPFQQAERATKFRSSALLNPAVLVSRYGMDKNDVLGTFHFGYPADIRPAGEALQKYASYSFLEGTEESNQFIHSGGSASFQSHSLGSSMDVLLTGTESLPALWLMDYNAASEVFNTPIGKQRKQEHIYTPDSHRKEDHDAVDGHKDSKSTVGLLVGMNTYISGPVANCSTLADDLLAPTSFLNLHTDPDGKVGSDVLLSAAIKASTERLKRMSVMGAANTQSAPATPTQGGIDNSTHSHDSHIFGGFKKALGSATKKSISVLTLGSVHGHDVDPSTHDTTERATMAAPTARKKAYEFTLGEDPDDYRNFEIDPYEACAYGIEGDDSIRQVRALLHFQRGITNAKNLQQVFQSVINEPAVPYTGDRIYLSDNLVKAILERNNLAVQLSLPDLTVRAHSVMFIMRESVEREASPLSVVTAKRRTFLTISFEDIDFSLSASPSVPPPVKSPTKKRRMSASGSTPAQDTNRKAPTPQKNRRFSLNPTTWKKPFGKKEEAQEDTHFVAPPKPAPRPLAMGGMPVMGCPLRHYGNARKLIDLSGLLLIVKLSIQSIRVCTYIAPNEFQGSKTNGITAAIASGIATIAASAGGGGGGPSRRKSTTGYHTPFAPEPKEVKSRRVSELTVEEEGAANGKAEDGNDPGIAGNNTGETASGWGDDVSVSSGLQGSKRKIVWSTTDLIPESIDAAAGSGGGDSTANAKPSGGEKAFKAADAKEDIMMCVLDSNPSGSSSTDKFLNLCVILDFPEKSLGVSIEAVDVQCALGPLSVTVGRNELCVLLSPANTTLCRRVAVALQGVLNLSGVLQDEHFLLREFSSPVLLHQHLPSVLIGSGRCHIGNYISSRTRQLKGHNKAKSDSFDGYFAFLRSRDCALGRNIDILKHLNYAKYYSILSQALPNTLSIYVRTSEVSATLFSAAMVKSFVTNLADVMSCAAVDGFMKSTLSTARDYADADLNKASLLAIRQAVLATLDVVQAASEGSQRGLAMRREQWAFNNAPLGAIGQLDNARNEEKVDAASVNSDATPVVQRSVLFTLDDNDRYSIDDAMEQLQNNNFGIAGGHTQTKSVLDTSYHCDGNRQTAARDEETNTNIVVRSVVVSVPSFTFELNKSISASEYQEAQFEDGNIEAIYGILSVKLFGIGVSIPMDDASLCQFLSMCLGNAFPLYPYVSGAGGDSRDASLSERGLRRGLFESAPEGSKNVVLPPPILPEDIATIDISPFDNESLLSKKAKVEKPSVTEDVAKRAAEAIAVAPEVIKPAMRNTYTQTDDEVKPKTEIVAPAEAAKLSVNVMTPPPPQSSSGRLFASIPDADTHGAWGGPTVEETHVNEVPLTPALAAHASTEPDRDTNNGTPASIEYNTGVVTVPVVPLDSVTPPDSPVTAAEELTNDATPPGSPVNNDPETAPEKEVGTVTPDATPPGTPRDTDVGVAVVASGHKEEVAEPVPDAEEAQETEVPGGVDAESASRNVLGSTVPRQRNREQVPHSWRPVKAAAYQVRAGPNYKRNKHKVNSERALYDPVAVDVFRVDSPIPNIASRVSFPSDDVTTDAGNAHNGLLPTFLVVQIMVPASAPSLSMFGGHTDENGPGYAVVLTFKITELTKGYLANFEVAPAAVKHFLNFVRSARDDDDVRGLLKVICKCPNADKVEDLSSVVTSYNNTPTVLKKTTSVFKEADYFEIDINVYQFSTLVQRTIHSMLSCVGEMQLQLALVVEGALDEELPECLFGVVELCKPQADQIPHF